RRLISSHFLAKADAYLHCGVYPSIFEQAPTSHLVEAAGGPPEAAQPGMPEPDHEHEHVEVIAQNWLEAFGQNFIPIKHRHVDETGNAGEVLPWLRLAADLNPNQIEAYTVGAYWLRSRLGKTREAEVFLREGWRANPNSYEILFELARLYEENWEDLD